MALAKIDTERGRRDHDRQAMIAYEALLFPIFLIVALLGQLLPRASAKGGARPSAFAEAADLTESVVPWFFVHR